jgi:hypothetical protein
VGDAAGVAGVGDGRVDGIEEASRLTEFTEQEGPGVGGQPAAEEVGDDLSGAKAGMESDSRLQSVIAVTLLEGDNDRYNSIS